MKFATWKDEYSVGNKMIDSQHKELFLLINNFYNAVRRKETQDAIVKLIGNLEIYVMRHFTYEEKKMLRYNFSEYELHHQEHIRFSKQVEDYKKRITEGKLVLTIEISKFLRDWLTVHILNSDQKYKGIIE